MWYIHSLILKEKMWYNTAFTLGGVMYKLRTLGRVRCIPRYIYHLSDSATKYKHFGVRWEKHLMRREN